METGTVTLLIFLYSLPCLVMDVEIELIVL